MHANPSPEPRPNSLPSSGSEGGGIEPDRHSGARAATGRSTADGRDDSPRREGSGRPGLDRGVTRWLQKLGWMGEHTTFRRVRLALTSLRVDQRLRHDTARTAMATALRMPTSTTSRLPRVMPQLLAFRMTMSETS